MPLSENLLNLFRDMLRSVVEASVDTGVADATSTVNFLDDAAKSWPVDAFVNLIVEITGGTGEGQIRKIASNTATRVTPVAAFDTAPDATSTYRIGFFGKIASDITHWGGTLLTGRDISDDLAQLQKLIPVAEAAVFNTALPAAEAAWLGADITPTNSPSYLRLYVCVAVAGAFRVARTVGGVTVVEDINSGADLVADSAYMFTIEWRTGDSLNFRYSATGANIVVFRATEIGGAE